MSDNSRITKEAIILDQLAAFGLTNTEARIYLHLTGKAPKSILEIARELDLPRTSIYDSAVKLSEKGLLQRIVRYKSQQLQAYPLSILQTYIDREKSRIEELQGKLASLEEAVLSAEASPLSTEVRYYHGPKGLQQMIWNTLRTRSELVGYSQFGLVDVVSKRFTEKYAAELIRRGIHNRVITNPRYVDAWRLYLEPLATYRRTLQQCKAIDPKRLYVSGDTTIYNNVFATAYWEHGEIVGVEIENPEIVKMQRSMFDLTWGQAKSVEFITPS
ncbi:MAG TPA: helix-turn-helix domain-containing protein [Candidatus Saccharimonadales bacterium]|nr:helix-turn-helix domain-containing protein [Candidatus Saccharimonadales bacterium]